MADDSTPAAPRTNAVWPDSRHQRELLFCLAVAAAIVLLQSVVPLAFEQFFDSDQAVSGLMAKHLSEFRAFPLFFYGQNYLLGVQSWLAVPFFWIGGPTVAMLRAPLVILNLTVGLGFVWFLARQGVRPRYALAAALPVVALTPAKAMEFGAASGAGIEPLGYALILWLLRHRPIAFGAVLGFGTLHREFTFLALPALALVEWRQPAFWTRSSLAQRAGGFVAVWLVVDLIKRNVNVYGPPGGTWAAGSVALGAKTFLSWLAFDWAAYAARTWDMVTWGIPEMLGVRTYELRTYGIPSDLDAGSPVAGLALGLAVAIALLRTIGLAIGDPRVAGERRRLSGYLALLAVLNLLIYGLNSGIPVGDPPVLRYAIFAPLLPIALFATYFPTDASRRWRAATGLALALWAAGNVLDNARLAGQFVREPPPGPHRIVADYLTGRGIRYARARYWDAYVITFLSRERVIVASTETVRISAYQADVDRHASEAVTLQRLPCEGGTQVAAWCVIGPDGR